jgi:hypothetical protein
VAPDRSRENISRIVSDILGFRTFAAALGVAILVTLGYVEPHFAVAESPSRGFRPGCRDRGSDWLSALENQPDRHLQVAVREVIR